MKVPRFGIGLMMVCVAIIALDVAAIRALYLLPKPGYIATPAAKVTQIEMLARGSLPMANVLAIGLMLGLRRHRSRTALLGFGAFGVAVLILYSALVIFVIPNHFRYGHFVQWLRNQDPVLITNQHVPCQVAVSIVLVLPQLIFALVGGFLFGRLNTIKHPN